MKYGNKVGHPHRETELKTSYIGAELYKMEIRGTR